MAFYKKAINIHILTLIGVIFSLSLSFYHDWYLDTSKPQSGIGSGDQDYYLGITPLFIEGLSLQSEHFHFQLGYSALGIFDYLLFPSDPFMPNQNTTYSILYS